ncbi:MAG: glutamate--tRNA ligase family protein [Chthoniobacterales bacterium]
MQTLISANPLPYRGRIAPTPTGLLHLGHFSTFWIAQKRAEAAQGTLIYRSEDLDPQRCKPEFAQAAIEDLHQAGLSWQEGPDIGGPHAPYVQSQRTAIFLKAWARLRDGGFIYPCKRSRKDIAEADLAPHKNSESLFPVTWRPPEGAGQEVQTPGDSNWRFRVPDGQQIRFADKRLGLFSAEAGKDFGDFLVWRRDGIPAYELAVVADDIEMQISEVVRGEDLLLSTCRQLLIYEALGASPPDFYHTPLLRDLDGQRLAKRNNALSLQALHNKGISPKNLLKMTAPDQE